MFTNGYQTQVIISLFLYYSSSIIPNMVNILKYFKFIHLSNPSFRLRFMHLWSIEHRIKSTAFQYNSYLLCSSSPMPCCCKNFIVRMFTNKNFVPIHLHNEEAEEGCYFSHKYSPRCSCWSP